MLLRMSANAQHYVAILDCVCQEYMAPQWRLIICILGILSIYPRSVKHGPFPGREYPPFTDRYMNLTPKTKWVLRHHGADDFCRSSHWRQNVQFAIWRVDVYLTL